MAIHNTVGVGVNNIALESLSTNSSQRNLLRASGADAQVMVDIILQQHEEKVVLDLLRPPSGVNLLKPQGSSRRRSREDDVKKLHRLESKLRLRPLQETILAEARWSPSRSLKDNTPRVPTHAHE
jgi:hypothetical protein